MSLALRRRIVMLLAAIDVASSAGCERSNTPQSALAKAVPGSPVMLTMGATQAPASTSRCPEGMALVAMVHAQGEICVDKYEASIDGQLFSHALDAGSSRAAARSASGVKPQVNVNADEAAAACEAASKRLCTEAEWTAACRGPRGLVYPYGNEHVAGACNEGRSRPPGATMERLDDPALAEAPNTIEKAGSFPKCVSDDGIFDMHGNVEEWVSGSPGDDPKFGIFMGGYFAEASANGAGCAYKTTVHIKTYRDYSIGFRCCKDAGP